VPVNGMKPPEIARAFGWKKTCAHQYVWRIHGRWISTISASYGAAVKWGLNEMPDLQASGSQLRACGWIGCKPRGGRYAVWRKYR
jgi:hypothetical protein